jgi:hypothetical protein
MVFYLHLRRSEIGMTKMLTGVVTDQLFWDDLVDMFQDLEVEKEQSSEAMDRGFENDMQMFVHDAMETIGLEPSPDAVVFMINSVGLIHSEYQDAELHIRKVPEGFYVAIATA